MERLIELFLNLGLPLLVLMGAYFIGTAIEQRHYRQLRARESASQDFLTVSFPYQPEDRGIVAAQLVTGSVVISIDYFKRFLAGLRLLVGGRVKSYETLLDRGRREAIMRLREAAQRGGFHAVVNVRLETARLASSKGGQGTAGIEVLAFGTALRFAR
ncbi:MAG: YbjQ family protein [Acidobacteriota bacterium]